MKEKKVLTKVVWVSLIAMSFIFTLTLSSIRETRAEDLKIGIILPMSGPMALIGKECFEGIEAARVEQNDKGGLLGKKIEFVVVDAPDSKAGAGAAERLITVEKVKFIIGTYSSSISYAATTVADKYGVPYFEMVALSEDITTRGFKYVFRTAPSGSMYSYAAVQCMAEYLAPKMGKKPNQTSMANVYEDSLFGTTMAKYGAEAAKKYGIKVVGDEPYKATTSDLTPVILRLKAAKPDFLLHPGYLTDQILFYRQARELRFDIKTSICSGGLALPAFGEALGNGADGIQNVGFGFNEPNPLSKGFNEFNDLFKKVWGKPISTTNVAVTYFGAKVALQVIEKAKTLDAEAIRKAALSMDIPVGTTVSGGGVKFDPKTGQNMRAINTIFQWQDKGTKMPAVWPEKAAIAKMIFPLTKWEDKK